MTLDGRASAQFEETLLVTNTGVEVLTAAKGWKLPKLPKGTATTPSSKIGTAASQVPMGEKEVVV